MTQVPALASALAEKGFEPGFYTSQRQSLSVSLNEYSYIKSETVPIEKNKIATVQRRP